MARPFNELRNKMSLAARKRAGEKAAKMIVETPRHELGQVKAKNNPSEDVSQANNERRVTGS